MKKTIPIFFASNDAYVPYLDVAITSIIENSSKENDYEIIVLKTDISTQNQNKRQPYNDKNHGTFYDSFDVEFGQLYGRLNFCFALQQNLRKFFGRISL